MEAIKTIREGVEKVLAFIEFKDLKKWELIPAEQDDLTDTFIYNGKKYPLLWWREDTQLKAIKNNSTLIDPVSCKLNCVTAKSEGLKRLMFREFDLAEWFLCSEFDYLNAYINGNSANIIVTMKNKLVATLELGATLADGTIDQGKHSVWGKNGMLGDRIVSEKLTQQAIYLFTDKSNQPKTFNDNDFQLYGLNKIDVNKAAAIIQIIRGQLDVSDWNERAETYKKYIEIAFKSSVMNQKMIVERK